MNREIADEIGIIDNGILVIHEGVKEIPGYCYRDNTDIVKVIIPSSVEEIGKLAFDGCSNLEEVIISKNNNIKYIMSRAFYGCINLKTSLRLANLERMGRLVFCDCKSITSIYLGKCISLGESVFYNCEKLRLVLSLNDIAEFDNDKVFHNCNAELILTSIDMLLSSGIDNDILNINGINDFVDLINDYSSMISLDSINNIQYNESNSLKGQLKVEKMTKENYTKADLVNINGVIVDLNTMRVNGNKLEIDICTIRSL